MDFSSNGSEKSELHHAQIHVTKHVNNYLSSMALKSAVELGIADAIHNHGKAMTLSELASSLKLHPSQVTVLQRFMRLLTHNGFFTKTRMPSPNGKQTLLSPSHLIYKQNKIQHFLHLNYKKYIYWTINKTIFSNSLKYNF